MSLADNILKIMFSSSHTQDELYFDELYSVCSFQMNKRLTVFRFDIC